MLPLQPQVVALNPKPSGCCYLQLLSSPGRSMCDSGAKAVHMAQLAARQQSLSKMEIDGHLQLWSFCFGSEVCTSLLSFP